MKTLIIYYSLDGNCALIAENLKSCLKAEVLEIKTLDTKKRKGFALYFWGGSQVLFRKKPPLKPYTIDVNAWDLIILGTPVWAGSPAPAISSFLDKTKISGKKLALYCCHGGGMGEALEKFKALLPGNTFAGEINFKVPRREDASKVKQQTEEWAKTLAKKSGSIWSPCLK